MLKSVMLVSALLFAGSAAAEEVIIEHPPAVEERAPATSRTTVEHHDRDCDSKSVHTENDAGDSKTVTHEECD